MITSKLHSYYCANVDPRFIPELKIFKASNRSCDWSQYEAMKYWQYLKYWNSQINLVTGINIGAMKYWQCWKYWTRQTDLCTGINMRGNEILTILKPSNRSCGWNQFEGQWKACPIQGEAIAPLCWQFDMPEIAFCDQGWVTHQITESTQIWFKSFVSRAIWQLCGSE